MNKPRPPAERYADTIWTDKEDARSSGLNALWGPYLDCFYYYAGMELRYDNDTFSHLATLPLYPKMDFIPELERNGFTGDLYGLAPLTMFKAILRDNRCETLLKSGRTEHFRYFAMHSTNLETCWNSYKIAIRNHY